MEKASDRFRFIENVGELFVGALMFYDGYLVKVKSIESSPVYTVTGFVLLLDIFVTNTGYPTEAYKSHKKLQDIPINSDVVQCMTSLSDAEKKNLIDNHAGESLHYVQYAYLMNKKTSLEVNLHQLSELIKSIK